MEQLVQYLAESLAQEPGKVELSRAANDHGPVLFLKVAESDVNIMIGRQGRTIKAMRQLLAAAAGKSGQRLFLEIDPSLAQAKAETKEPPSAE